MKWVITGVTALIVTAALADICPPIHHYSQRTIHKWALWRAAHPHWHQKKVKIVVCAPAKPALPAPPLEPFPVTDQEQFLLTEIAETPNFPPANTQPPIYTEYIEVDWYDYDWIWGPDIGVPDEGGYGWGVLAKAAPRASTQALQGP